MIFNQKDATTFLNSEYNCDLKDYFLTADRRRKMITSCGTKGKEVLYEEDELRRYAKAQGYAKRNAMPFTIKVYKGKQCLLWGKQFNYIKNNPAAHSEVIATDDQGLVINRWSYNDVHQQIVNGHYREQYTSQSGKKFFVVDV